MGKRSQIHSNNGNKTFGNEHAMECTDIELLCCAIEIYIVLLTSVTSFIKWSNYLL